MPFNGCTNGVVAMLVLSILFLPVQYYVPEWYEREPEVSVAPPPPAYTFAWPQLDDIPVFDTVYALTLVLLISAIHVYDWVQRKLLERRINKLNQRLKESVNRLRDYDTRQQQLTMMLHTVKKATAEYDLLLYLLLRRQRLAQHEAPPADLQRNQELDLSL